MGNQGQPFSLNDRRDNSWSAYRLLCACGYRVRCEVMRYGDDTESSMTRGERVRDCPGCHDQLGLLGLRA
jgi:hypothetical protein